MLNNLDEIIAAFTTIIHRFPQMLVIVGGTSTSKTTLVNSIIKAHSDFNSLVQPTTTYIQQILSCYNKNISLDLLHSEYLMYDEIVFEDYDYLLYKKSITNIILDEIVKPLLSAGKRVIITATTSPKGHAKHLLLAL